MPIFKNARKNKVVIIFGDHNAVGQALSANTLSRDQSPFPRVKIWNSTQFEDLEVGVNSQASAGDFGPELGIARTWTETINNNDENLYIVKYGNDNTYLDTNWGVSGGVQTAAAAVVNGALASPELYNQNNEFYLCWMLGEYDSQSQTHADNYEAFFPDMIEWLEETLNQRLERVAIGRISDVKVRDYNATVRQAQENLAESNGSYDLIDLDDCMLDLNPYFLNSSGQFLLGERSLRAFLDLETESSNRYIFVNNEETQYVDLPQSISDAFTGCSSFEIEYSIAFDLGSTFYVISIGDSAVDGVQCWVNSGNIRADINNNADIIQSGFDDEVPHRVKVSWDGTTLSQTVDGGNLLTAAKVVSIDVTTPPRLFVSSSSIQNYFHGMVGDIRITVDGVMIARYETGDAIDSSGNGNHGTVVNGPIRDVQVSELFRGKSTNIQILSEQDITHAPIYSPLHSDYFVGVQISNLENSNSNDYNPGSLARISCRQIPIYNNISNASGTSAVGPSNDYIVLEVDGVKYKMLHAGTV